jgi:CRP/FNR family cyclic AMP-dependent transcriptional regulator
LWWPSSSTEGIAGLVRGDQHLEADPELGDLLPEPERERARREALTHLRRLSSGEWRVAEAIEPDRHHRGFMVIDGLISREVDVLGRRCVELIGPGDVL